MFEKKTFMVADAEGNKTIEAEQLGTFAFYIQAVQHRFVVTQIPGTATVALTDRASGKKVRTISHTSIQAALGDYVVAGKGELQKLIDAVGAARVRSVLAAG